MRISGPYAHENLVLFFLHGPSQPGPVPLTLEEALAKGKIDVKATGQVSELTLENLGDEDVFIQSGDLVKGGRQDRVLEVSFVVGPKSRPIPASSRGLYDRAAKLAIRQSYAAGAPYAHAKQNIVWDRVARSQEFLSRSLGRSVHAAASPSSLQLSLESEDLACAEAAYVERLSPLGTTEG